MSKPIENIDMTEITPMMQRLLNKPLLSQGRSGLVMSLRRRERVMCKEQELADFLLKHPWWGQIEGYHREIIRRILFNLERVGRELDAQCLEQVLFTVGDCLGPKVMWPILSHLLDGGAFDCLGKEISDGSPNAQKMPPVPLQQFLEEHAPKGTRVGQLLAVKMILKAVIRTDTLVREAIKSRT